MPPGPYFSPLLLHTLHAQASRHLAVREEGWTYGVSAMRLLKVDLVFDHQDRANALLVPALTAPPALTTVQALLILAGRDLALNMSSAGWLKSGMAFRMIEDMGLVDDAMLDLTEVPAHRQEEVAMRKRVFWSAYSWDKRAVSCLIKALLIEDSSRSPWADVRRSVCRLRISRSHEVRAW